MVDTIKRLLSGPPKIPWNIPIFWQINMGMTRIKSNSNSWSYFGKAKVIFWLATMPKCSKMAMLLHWCSVILAICGVCVLWLWREGWKEEQKLLKMLSWHKWQCQTLCHMEAALAAHRRWCFETTCYFLALALARLRAASSPLELL